MGTGGASEGHTLLTPRLRVQAPDCEEARSLLEPPRPGHLWAALAHGVLGRSTAMGGRPGETNAAKACRRQARGSEPPTAPRLYPWEAEGSSDAVARLLTHTGPG